MYNQSEFLIFVLYDGISNSIFEGQVLAPLKKIHKKDPKKQILLISFEYDLLQKIPDYGSWIRIIILRKYFFLTRMSLYLAYQELQNYLKTFSRYTLIARGPFAALICYPAAQKTLCARLIIQIRGLLQAEHSYTTRNQKGLLSYINRYRSWQYYHIEKEAYNLKKTHFKITIEAVSKELLIYIRKHYATNLPAYIALNDIPQKLSPKLLTTWRKKIRNILSIDANDYVYCYNGSVKPWQCPALTIQFFCDQIKQGKKCTLIILTQEPKAFFDIIKEYDLDAQRYRILSVSHAEIYHYLAACDAGILFREKNIINWTSRPTKVLEYFAARLTIIHNNTVAMVRELQSKSCAVNAVNLT